MRINYYINAENRVTGWTAIPLNESLPIIDIENPESIRIGIDKIIEGQFIRDDEKAEEVEESLHRDDRIRELKKLLADTDYEAIKFTEGELTEEEFAPIKAQRHAWRLEIRELESVN